MVAVIIGDMFKSSAQTLVNTVNCVGVMGKGVALEFKKRFPEMYEDYVQRCERNEVKLGRPYLYRRQFPPWILNFPTKDHWRAVARLSDIVAGLDYLEKHYLEWGITSLAMPPLGCGQGGLEWRVVGPTLHRYLRRLVVPVELYAPFGTPHEQLQPSFLDQLDVGYRREASPTRVPTTWLTIVEIIRRVEQEPYHWPVGRIMLQKLVYFATAMGIPTGFDFQRGSFGPYSPDVPRMITQLVNNGLIQEERRGSMFVTNVGPTYDDALHAYGDEIRKWEPVINQVVNLARRVTTHQAEVAATVHFAAKMLQERLGDTPSEVSVFDEVMEWKQRRKPPFEKSEIASTIRNLAIRGWLRVTISTNLPIEEEALV